MSLRYIRKAADEGSAQAQYDVGDMLAPIDIAPDVARQMRRCAAEQGNGNAAVALGVDLKIEGRYQEALEVFQMGVVAGHESAAGWLEEAFRGHPPSDELYYLGQQQDLERAERYNAIWSLLADYSYADPKVPEINESLPGARAARGPTEHPPPPARQPAAGSHPHRPHPDGPLPGLF